MLYGKHLVLFFQGLTTHYFILVLQKVCQSRSEGFGKVYCQLLSQLTFSSTAFHCLCTHQYFLSLPSAVQPVVPLSIYQYFLSLPSAVQLAVPASRLHLSCPDFCTPLPASPDLSVKSHAVQILFSVPHALWACHQQECLHPVF